MKMAAPGRGAAGSAKEDKKAPASNSTFPLAHQPAQIERLDAIAARVIARRQPGCASAQPLTAHTLRSPQLTTKGKYYENN
jgi:hypothetical protein